MEVLALPFLAILLHPGFEGVAVFEHAGVAGKPGVFEHAVHRLGVSLALIPRDSAAAVGNERMDHGVVEDVGLAAEEDVVVPTPRAGAVEDSGDFFARFGVGVELLHHGFEMRNGRGHFAGHPGFDRGAAPAGLDDADGRTSGLFEEVGKGEGDGAIGMLLDPLALAAVFLCEGDGVFDFEGAEVFGGWNEGFDVGDAAVAHLHV